MVAPLVETKLEVPARRRGLVTRPRLSQRLESDGFPALTLICAPAGFGKTTLLTEWLTSEVPGRPKVAWLSLDDRDNDPVQFWTYVIAALNASMAHTVSAETLAILGAQQPALDAVVAGVVNDLHHDVSELVLVLDDYHVMDSREVQETVALFLEHLPRRAHLAITSRIDPDLPVALLRARGELLEIRAEDLRFTPDEAAAYLTNSMGLQLTEHDVATLDGRTEGWIAALQLAALSMQGRDDPATFIAGFAGDDRYIVDFLTQEVMQRQPADVQEFLLKTSILERLNASLCDAVTGKDDGKTKLAALEHANLFLVPLDAQRKWYRYHALFADVLHSHLLDEQPDVMKDLHHRASAWFEDAADTPEAIHHALAANDYERAATLMEGVLPLMRQARQEAVIRSWLQALPEDLLATRPVLAAGFASAMAASGQFEGIDTLFRHAEWWLDPARAGSAKGTRTAEIVVVDEVEFVRLPANVQMLRAGRSLVEGDLEATVDHAQQAIELSPSDDSLPRAGATALVALASWARGDLDRAHDAYAEGRAMLQRVGHHADVLGCTLALADIRLAQGRLGDAIRTCQQGLELVATVGSGAIRGTADMHVALSYLHGERGEYAQAAEHLQRSDELGEHLGLPQHRYRWRVAKARLFEADEDLDAAMLLLDEADRVYTGDFSPNVRPVPAVRARLHLARNDLSSAQAWVQHSGLRAQDELSYVHEFEHVTLARVLLAQVAASDSTATLAAAEGLLARLLTAAEDGRRQGTAIEVLMLSATAHQLRDDPTAALRVLDDAVCRAAAERHVRLFTDEAARLASLLKALVNNEGRSAGFARQLLGARRSHDSQRANQPLVEPLSERELEVLRLLATELDGPGIARHLVVSLNTVRTHTKHIYSKLGVNNRRAAVRHGRQMHLL